jgi:hypothetical protein
MSGCYGCNSCGDGKSKPMSDIPAPPLSAWEGLIEGAEGALMEEPSALMRCIRAAAQFRGDNGTEEGAQELMQHIKTLIQTQGGGDENQDENAGESAEPECRQS